jgi:hypothetical protein
VAVVHFQDFDIEILVQQMGGLAGQVKQQIDPEREVGGIDYRDKLGRGIDSALVFLGHAGGADDMGGVIFFCIGTMQPGRCGAGEINHNIGNLEQVFRIIGNFQAGVFAAGRVPDRAADQRTVMTFGAAAQGSLFAVQYFPDQGLAHASAAPDNTDSDL